MATRTAFGWKDIDAMIAGDMPTEIKEITYKKTVAKQNNYGKGSEPTSRSRGNKEYEGNIIMSMAEVVALRKAAGPGKDETDIAPFDIPVTYTNESNGIVIDTIRGVEFLEAVGGGAQNDLEILHEMPIIFSKIDFNQSI